MDVNVIETEVLGTAISPDQEEEILKKIGINSIPFKTKLSFLPLIECIENRVDSEDYAESFLAKNILERLEQEAPELKEPIEDFSLLEKHKPLLQLLMVQLFPPALRNTQLAKVSEPFGLKPLYMTPSLEKLWRENTVDFVSNKSSNIIHCATLIRACSLILNRFYGQNLVIDPPISLTVKRPDSLLQRFFKTQMNLNFIQVKPLKPLKPLSQEQINHLLSNIYDIDLWLEHIPANAFEFQGFIIGELVDITEEESLSRLKFTLLGKDAVMEVKKIRGLEQLLRNYFGLADIRLGVTAIDYPLENAVAHKYKIRFDFLANQQERLLVKANANSLYEKACKYREVLLIEDLKALNNKTPIESGLIKQGIRSIIVAPLFNKNEQVIGLLEIGSPTPYEIHSFVELKFKEIIGMFSMAVERSREEMDNRVEAVIREQYTALHPSVEWKFIQNAYNLLEDREKDEQATVAPIIFNDVYPLYGQADIVSSSTKRNYAIQSDLIDNLEMAKKVLEKCIKHVPFPLASQIKMKVELGIGELKEEFNSNDESRIVELLHLEVHPLFEQMRKRYPDLAGNISTYFDFLDEELGIVYRKRKAYEDSVSLVNKTIGNYLEQQEKITQKVLPHYFEKYKTDGVEYDIYLGQSLLNKDRFSQMHLRNFRLWQLIHMVEITRKVRDLQDKLLVPLTTAQLIFAYTNPLSIRFRMDEKQFDVDGAYNVRYEILKKRIDKAVIEGTTDRLTVENKVAIVYLQEKDRAEYLEYFDYLIHEGYITSEVEDLRLGKLQGVQGLKALRITVRYK